MSLTKTQWENIKQLIPAEHHAAALKLWNSAMRTVQDETRRQDAVERLHRMSASTAAKASQATTPPICTSPTPDVSQLNSVAVNAQIEILELLLLEMKRTGKTSVGVLSDVPSTLKT